MLTLLLLRRRQHPLDTPSTMNAVSKRLDGNAYSLCPFWKRERDSVECDAAIADSVSLLLSLGSPSTIARFVMAVVVDAVQRGAWWHRPHVFVKGSEVVAPPIAHRDSAPAVSVKVLRRSAVTTLNHATPDFVFMAVAKSVRGVSFDCAAATTTGLATQKALCFNEQGGSTQTATVPHDAPVGALVRWRHCRQSAERVAGYVFGVVVERPYSVVSHVASCQIGAVVRGWRSLATIVSLAKYPTKSCVGGASWSL